MRMVDASPIPTGWNGKAHGLQVGLDRADPSSAWILTIDADVRPAPALVRRCSRMRSGRKWRR